MFSIKKPCKRIMGNKRRMGSERYKNIDNPKGTPPPALKTCPASEKKETVKQEAKKELKSNMQF
jgi:hypothetical protein